jgi:hypothetical protein
MAEPGCLHDAHFQNLEASGNSTINKLTVETTATLGTRKIMAFAGTLVGVGTSPTYSDNDCLVELGTLDVDPANTSLVDPSKIFIHKVVILITTTAQNTLAGNLALSSTSGTATNAAVTGTEIVGAQVDSFNAQTSLVEGSLTEADISFNATAGDYHVFTPNVTAPIANKHLYARTTTTLSSAVTDGRFTVEIEYSVL